MQTLDWIVLGGYFVVLAGIGLLCMWRVKVQEDYFMGGRKFGKLLQTFAAFGAGTGSQDPVATATTSWRAGFSGMWSVMYWLFVTPFYWITAVWYRRMRHLTLGDWFVERYDSKSLGAGYTIFGLLFFIFYGSMMFAAIGKIAAPLIGDDTVVIAGNTFELQYVLVPAIAVFVLIYGIAGGLKAAYWTDLLQGAGIITLSVILIPAGLNMLIERFGDPSTQTAMDGFQILHERLPETHFDILGSGAASQFPWYMVLTIVIINLIGVVVQPHFIATGGGSAKTENSARVGLVTGNFLKRFCTIGWALTALICLALFADSQVLAEDPDKVWGVASRELLAPGLTGLMLACMLAALMSSIDAYMIVGSGLVVRNLYAPYINANASEKTYVTLGRITGAIVVIGAVIVALTMWNVFAQLQLTWTYAIIFAAPFWIGMWWRRATKWASWMTVLYCVGLFFVAPALVPALKPELREDLRYLGANDVAITITQHPAARTDVEQRQASIERWEALHAQYTEAGDETALRLLGNKPEPLERGEMITDVNSHGGKAVYWTDGVRLVDDEGEPLEKQSPALKQINEEGEKQWRITNEHFVEVRREETETTTTITARFADDVNVRGFGDFNADFLLYDLAGLQLSTYSDGVLNTLQYPTKIITPFLVMILLSFITPRTRKEVLDRYYTKMKVPVHPDHDEDVRRLELAYQNPAPFEHRKMFPGTSLEMQKPRWSDVVGFIVCLAICFGVIWCAMLVAGLGT